VTGEGNHNKSDGTRRERKAKKLLEADGYHVVRVAASLGAADLLAAKIGQRLLVQVKSEEYLAPGPWNELYDEARVWQAIPIHCAVIPRKVVWRKITAPKTVRTTKPPWEPWTADEVLIP
jgi:Holliday junction resolvase